MFALAACGGDRYLKARDGFLIGYEYEEVPAARGTVILLHGLGSNLGEWYTFKKDLIHAGWSVMAVDLRGHGISNWHQGEPIHWYELSEKGVRGSLLDVDAAVRHVSPEENLWMIGSSFGSAVAINYAAAREGVRGVVMLTPGPAYGGLESQQPLREYPGPVMLVAAEDDGAAARVAKFLGEVGEGERNLVILEEAGHGSVMLESGASIREEIIAWMNQKSR